MVRHRVRNRLDGQQLPEASLMPLISAENRRDVYFARKILLRTLGRKPDIVCTMASEVNKAPEFVESEMHEQPIVDNEQYIVRVRKYLLVLLFIQWVSSLSESFVDISPV